MICHVTSCLCININGMAKRFIQSQFESSTFYDD